MNVLIIIGIGFVFIGTVLCTVFLLAFGPEAFVLIPLIFVLLGGFFLYRSLRELVKHRKLRKNGKRLYGEIVELSPNYSLTINDSPTFILHCEVNGVPYEWEYPRTRADDLVGKRVTLYVDQDDPAQYFVDIKSIT